MTSSSRRLHDWEEALRIHARRDDPQTEWEFRCLEACGSTMDAARALLADPAPDRPALVLTEQQTAGRGRQGRGWEELSSGFYGTYVFPTRLAPAALAGFSLAVGTVLTDVLKILGCPARLKWPNDVLSEGRQKMCGILIELVSGPPAYLLVGIGINLSGDVSHISYPGGVTTLQRETGRAAQPIEVAVLLTARLFRAFRVFESSGLAAFRAEWMRQALYVGQTVTVDSGGDSHLRGQFIGIDDDGALLLASGGGRQRVLAGHVVSVE